MEYTSWDTIEKKCGICGMGYNEKICGIYVIGSNSEDSGIYIMGYNWEHTWDTFGMYFDTWNIVENNGV